MMALRSSASPPSSSLSSLFLLLIFLIGSVSITKAGEVLEEEGTTKRRGNVIGIDLGTTYSCVGIYRNKNGVEIIANDQGNRITPSYVAFTTENKRLVGDAAKNQATMNPENTIFDVKRFIGRRYSDTSVQADRKLLPYKIVLNNNNKDEKPYIQVKIPEDNGDTVAETTTTTTKLYAPEEISAFVLIKLKQTAESFIGETIERAVITVPAYFSDAQRHATKDAGRIAGLHVERILNEPTAAAMAYGIQQDKKEESEEQNILVFDLGGGTFDVTILTIEDGVFQVLSTNGDTHLGGSDFDQSIMHYYIQQIQKKTNNKSSSIWDNKHALQRLRKEIERVKRALSTQLRAHMEIEDLLPGYDFSEMLTRAKFEELNHNLFQKTIKPIHNALDDAGFEKNEIDEIIMVGGSTRIPAIRALVSNYFDGKVLNHGINPDEAVAYGAAIQGSILSGKYNNNEDDTMKNIMLLDVTPLSLGTSVDDGIMSVLIPRGTTIPTKRSGDYVTLQDNQSYMTIDIYEGERSLVKDNHFLGEFVFTNIPPAPKGSVSITVTVRLDANGLLEVTAENKAAKNNKKQTITITSETGRLSQEDITRMIEEAELYAEEDKRVSEAMVAKNKLESFVYNLSTSLDEATTLSKEDEKELRDTMDETMKWLDSVKGGEQLEKETYDSKYQELEMLSRPLLRKLYNNNEDDEL